MEESRKKKKPTKKQAIDNLVKTYENLLKDSFITNMIHGFEIASKLYLDKIDNGCSVEELKEFIEKNIKNKDLIKENYIDKSEDM